MMTAMQPHNCGLRLRRLQQQVLEHGLDALLLIQGVDSQYHLGSGQAARFALGQSGRDVVSGTLKHAWLEDGILVVTPQYVQAWGGTRAQAEGVRKLLEHAGVEHQVHVLTEGEADDPDASEEAKLGAFVQMLRGFKKLGIPLTHPPEGSLGPDKPTATLLSPAAARDQLERWPLLMAYGMEGVGRDVAPFFTQCFQVYDMYDVLHAEVYGPLDGHAVGQLLQTDAHHLAMQWADMIQGVASQPATSLAQLSEQQLVEPLQAYFSYGTLRALPGVSKEVVMPPRALVGLRTNELHKHTTTATSNATLTTAGGPGCQVVIEAADGHSALRVARTYFLSTATLPIHTFADTDDEGLVVPPTGIPLGISHQGTPRGQGGTQETHAVIYLQRVYSALVAAARAGMAHFATQAGATLTSLKAAVMEALASSCAVLGVAQPSLSQQLCVEVWQADHANRVTQPAVQGSRYPKVVRLSLTDVRGPAGQSQQLLGGLVYADTFVEVPGTPTQPPGLLVLTQTIPALVCWPGATHKAAAYTQLSVNLNRMLAAAAAGVKGGGAAAAAAARKVQHRQQQQRRRVLAQLARAKKQQARGTQGGARLGNDASDTTCNGHDQGAEDDEQIEEEEEEDEEEGPNGQLSAHWPREEGVAALLGELLTEGAGEEDVILTGCAACPAICGLLHCFARGLVFIPHHSKAVWVMDFLAELEAITLQELHLTLTSNTTPHDPSTTAAAAAAPAAAAAAAAGSGSVGEAVVLRGRSPCCGLPPGCHLVQGTQLAIPLDALSQVARRHMLRVVLPAWQQACREGRPRGPGEPTEPMAYIKDPRAANPFPAACYAAHSAAVQSMAGTKVWSATLLPDAVVEGYLHHLDQQEMEAVAPPWQAVERLLLGAASPAAATTSPTAITLVAGLPGGPQAQVAQAVADLLGPGVATQVVHLPRGGGEQELHAALASACSKGPVQHLLLACETFVPLVHVLAWLACAPPVQQGRCSLSSVVGCAHPLLLVADGDRQLLQPGLHAQLPPGFLDVLVIAAPTNTEYKQAQSLLAKQLNTAAAAGGAGAAAGGGVHIVRADGASLLAARDELLPSPQARAARLAASAAARRWAYWPPQQTTTQTASSAPAEGTARQQVLQYPLPPPVRGPLQSVQLRFTGDLDVAALGAALAQLAEAGSTAAPAFPLKEAKAPSAAAAVSGPIQVLAPPPLGTSAQGPEAAVQALLASGCCILGVTGRLQGSSPAGPTQQLVWGRSPAAGNTGGGSGNWRLHTTRCAPLADDAQASGGELLVWGTQLEPSALQQLVYAASSAAMHAAAHAASEQQAQATILPEQLRAEEVAAVAAAHKYDELPAGYTFDGSRFYDAFGDPLDKHPLLSQFLEAHCRERSAALQQQQGGTQGAGPVEPLVLTRVSCQLLTA